MPKSNDNSPTSSNASTDFKCPLCDGAMTPIPDANGGGYWLKCYNPCDPNCHENVEGHGNTLKDAHAIACQKYHKSSSVA